MTKLDDVKFQVNCAAMEAMDVQLRELFPQFGADRVWITNKLVPRLLPTLEAITESALREVYDLMPESLDVDDATIARTKQQLEDSLRRVESLKLSQ